jgi:hypothetical protein
LVILPARFPSNHHITLVCSVQWLDDSC